VIKQDNEIQKISSKSWQNKWQNYCY